MNSEEFHFNPCCCLDIQINKDKVNIFLDITNYEFDSTKYYNHMIVKIKYPEYSAFNRR